MRATTMTGSSSKKSSRPVLSSHIAHAHAFAVLPTPGARATGPYFPLPAPPAPLRAFTLAQTPTQSTDGDRSTTYPTSLSSSQLEPRPKETSPDERKTKRCSGTPNSHTHSSSSRPNGLSLQFVSAVPFAVSSPLTGRSGGSALGIAEIDCFFVQGSRSSVYSNTQSPRSQPPAGSQQSDQSTTSGDDGEPSSEWMSDQVERERQRAERQAFMKARKEAREELRRQKRLAKAATSDTQTEITWREAIRSKTMIPLNAVPTTRESIERKRASTSESSQTTRPAAPAAVAPPPTVSGPGPPTNCLGNLLADDMATHLSLSEPAPALNRIDSGDTEKGASLQQL